MSQTHASSKQILDDLTHFAWCALVALRLAQQESRIESPVMVHAFLLRWLATALKQRRFPRTVTADIERLLTLGRQKGVAAGLYQRLASLWESGSTVQASAQSDMHRLTQALRSLGTQGWSNVMIADDEWNIPQLLAGDDDIPVLLVKKTALADQFNHQGQLTGPLEFIVKGDIHTVTSTLNDNQLRHTLSDETHNSGAVRVLPGLR